MGILILVEKLFEKTIKNQIHKTNHLINLKTFFVKDFIHLCKKFLMRNFNQIGGI